MLDFLIETPQNSRISINVPGSVSRLSVWVGCYVYLGRGNSGCRSKFNYDWDIYRTVCDGGKEFCTTDKSPLFDEKCQNLTIAMNNFFEIFHFAYSFVNSTVE